MYTVCCSVHLTSVSHSKTETQSVVTDRAIGTGVLGCKPRSLGGPGTGGY